MEQAILLGMGLAGLYANKDNYQIPINNSNLYRQNTPENIFHNSMNNKFINMSNFDDRYSDIRRSQRTLQKKKNKNKKNILSKCDTDLVGISEVFTDNSKSINKILKDNNKCNNQEESYLSQFDVQTFDSMGNPSAPNDIYETNDKSKLADLERKISYNGGWSQYDNEKMSYGIVPDEMLIHNNMVPNFSTKHGYGSNDYHNEDMMNYKNELFTGRLKSTWKRKEETKPLFKPEAELSYIYGTPVRSEEELERYIPSRFRQNEKPFEEQQVTPGVNLDYNEVGTHGFHSMYRVLDKTIDELRVKPKITYEGRIIDGKRGDKRPIQAPVITYKPDTYKINTEEDLLPKNNVVNGPKVKDNFIMKETDRSQQHIEYTGGAYTTENAVGRNVPEHMREKYKYSEKSNFTLPKPMQKFSKAESTYNQNINSYNLPATARAQTGHSNHIGTANKTSIAYVNPMDIAKPTIKETTSDIPQYPGQAISNTMRGTAQPMDIANPTIKETTIENRLNPNIDISDNKQRVYYSDAAKTTIRESTCEPIMPINVIQNHNIYANWSDIAKDTIKETTVQIPYNTNITPSNHSQRAPHPQDIMRPTMKQDTVQIPYNNNITPINHNQRAPHPQDIMRPTIKQDTVQIPYNNNITPINHSQRAPHPQDIMRPTMKQDTIQIPYNNNITPINHSQRAPHPQDIMRPTIKQDTVQIPYNNNITPINHSQRAPHPQDIMRPTIKQDTVQTPWNNFITPINQNQRTPHPQDIMKTTTKQDTVQIPWNNFVTPINQSQRAANPQDITKPTTKETTVCIPYNTVVTAVNQSQRTPNPQDNAKHTIRETTVQIPYNTIITAVDEKQGQANTFNRLPLKPTIKEELIQIPYNTNITAVTSQRPTTQYQDSAKHTIKETTVAIPRNTHIGTTKTGQTIQHQDRAKDTIKQTTVTIPYNSHITGVNQQQGDASTYNRIPLRETTKETTIDNKYISAPTKDVYGKGYGYMAEKMEAPNTNKQFTCQEVYITPLEGTAKSRPYTDAYNAEIDDRKESLHWYRPPTNSNVNMGPDPLQMNVVLKDDMRPPQIPAPGFTFNSDLDRMVPIGSVKIQNDNCNDRYIDPIILKQLETNEFNIPVF